MRQSIPLNSHNKKILIEKYGMLPEEFERTYWEKVVINSEDEMKLVFNQRTKKDIQSRIKSRAGKLLKKRLEQVLGLPKKSGSMERQRRWHKIFNKTGLERNEKL